ncbi:kinesin motor catalytic domain protein (macronuclear) [Tetrahymena thermophila SB210]|uniref:Kinesin-like protein n=1 Tax=Tetrahymena thermophila (strain SB210) TaxID=312017 RepID=Q22Z28_TETTS|nr:kinesin motor catalytic domain protein [Tetrahymena thermophila SB210]EAR90493.1 kinesin motor catalytic domain protein [Tetrahymena thermophila SB210]|eukprot:XP_001010738.1 kinesin motor catalytic domain protein [Tetrahymena thermophila SB210]
MDRSFFLQNRSPYQSKSAGKYRNDEDLAFEDYYTDDFSNEEYIKEYQQQNAYLNKMVKQRIIFLEELQQQENIQEEKRKQLQMNLAISKSKVQGVDSDLLNLISECKSLAEETTSKQDKLLQDKTNLQKKEAETLSLLNHHKFSLQKTIEKTMNYKQIYQSLEKQYQYYKENLLCINEKQKSLQEEIKSIQDGTHLDAQLLQFTQQKQNLNEKLQSMKGNIRVYCRIRPLRQEEKIAMLQNSFKKQYEEKQQNVQNPKITPLSKASVQKGSVGKVENIKGVGSVGKIDENNPNFQQEMQIYVQNMLDIIKDDDNLLYQMTQQNRIIKTQNSQNLKLVVPFQNMKSENNIKEYSFKLEHIFEEDATQMEVFSNLQELIQSVLDGYNVCIFAYGPTGSGKTYTMQGEEDYNKWGIIPRSIEYIYSEIEKMQSYGWEHKIKIQFSEIYNETLIDLLHPDGKKDEVQDKVITQGPEEIMKLLQKGYISRKVASTDCNEYSSRSHSIFRMNLDIYNTQKQGKNPQQPLLKGSLNLVDLAGSERINQSNVAGERLKETQNINKSLTSLAAVITSLAKKETFTAFRNSKLTYYLHEYLGGKSKTLMMVNISPAPSSFYPTLTTLRFADQAKQCQNKTEQNTIGISQSQRSISPMNNQGKQSLQKNVISTPSKGGRFQNILAQSSIRNTILNSVKK